MPIRDPLHVEWDYYAKPFMAKAGALGNFHFINAPTTGAYRTALAQDMIALLINEMVARGVDTEADVTKAIQDIFLEASNLTILIDLKPALLAARNREKALGSMLQEPQ